MWTYMCGAGRGTALAGALPSPSNGCHKLHLEPLGITLGQGPRPLSITPRPPHLEAKLAEEHLEALSLDTASSPPPLLLSSLARPPMPPSSRRAIRKLHLDTCAALGVEAEVRAEVEKLLSELSQLLIGICIMQVWGGETGERRAGVGGGMERRKDLH